MSLPILVALVAVGISLTVAAVHFTGGSTVSSIRDGGHALALFAADFPDEQPVEPVLTRDRHSAFMALPEGRIGIVQSFGDGFFTRIVSPADIAQARLREPATIFIRFRDFTWTGGNFTFDGGDAARRILASLQPAGGHPVGNL